ncbi:MAG: enoyl-CoA hydratase/isomerase family protein [Candidatus Bipolaricaulota bacterium]|nr:enoyl-CoA hydratase/isomerase family protein [Candidatus Bipolaricaulota bacterium]MCS7274790.1 enoyl-CoA hydratase/isomerase family protein [Candidatus Bipolaricaulota bacterium]MDW8110075.1 enoyl-CoA hydratase/isomerase family protein [Candidatus Bipolaricaulota bacterium]MDW8329610.1 enoyl-CoA hydratase/isomerase family protein [Candidatus Bipolaricaulota bacterium]
MKAIRIERDPAVAKVVLARPPLNVLGIAELRELSHALETLREDPAKVVVLAAEGRAFSAGVDIKDHTAEKVREMIAAVHEVFVKLWALEQPTVCVVQGMALGGGMELATACDFVIASENAQFGQPEIKVGVFPPIACLLLPRLLPWPKAIELILTGESISAHEAHRLGLVNRVASPEHLESEVRAFVSRLTALSGPVLKLAKRATLCGFKGRWEWEEALAEIERLYLDELMSLEDAHEGLRAFLEKRKPQWRER